MKKRLAALLFLALLYLPALGSSSSGTHPDESYYLGISAEMDAVKRQAGRPVRYAGRGTAAGYVEGTPAPG